MKQQMQPMEARSRSHATLLTRGRVGAYTTYTHILRYIRVPNLFLSLAPIPKLAVVRSPSIRVLRHIKQRVEEDCRWARTFLAPLFRINTGMIKMLVLGCVIPRPSQSHPIIYHVCIEFLHVILCVTHEGGFPVISLRALATYEP